MSGTEDDDAELDKDEVLMDRDELVQHLAQECDLPLGVVDDIFNNVESEDEDEDDDAHDWSQKA